MQQVGLPASQAVEDVHDRTAGSIVFAVPSGFIFIAVTVLLGSVAAPDGVFLHLPVAGLFGVIVGSMIGLHAWTKRLKLF
jgi:hypothetical protein